MKKILTGCLSLLALLAITKVLIAQPVEGMMGNESMMNENMMGNMMNEEGPMTGNMETHEEGGY